MLIDKVDVQVIKAMQDGKTFTMNNNKYFIEVSF